MVKPGYKQTEIGVIPEDWETSSLSAAFQKLEAGVSVNSDNALSSEYHILKTSAVHDGVVDTAETKPVIPQDYLRLKCPLVKGSIIISRMNTPALVGECGFTKDAKAGTYLPDRLWQIQNFNKSSFDFVWLNYLLNTKQYRDAVRATATGTSNSMKNISKERMLDIEIPRPPINEQENIAAALSEVDELINLVEKQIDKKKAIKQGAMQELLTGKRRLPGFAGEWVNTKIGSITEVYSGGTPNTSEPAFWGGKIPWMNSGELNLKIVRQVQGHITKAGMDSSSTHFIPAECVLIGLAGQGKTRGTAAFNTFPLCTNQSIAAIYPNPNKFDSKFLYYKMDTQYDQLRELSSGDGGRGGLNKKLILDYEVVIPQSIDEQAAIATILTEMDYEIENLEMKLTKYRQVKQGMMQQLLTGKICLEK
jgi:restriction modification system DNA specificity domain protein